MSVAVFIYKINLYFHLHRSFHQVPILACCPHASRDLEIFLLASKSAATVFRCRSIMNFPNSGSRFSNASRTAACAGIKFCTLSGMVKVLLRKTANCATTRLLISNSGGFWRIQRYKYETVRHIKPVLAHLFALRQQWSGPG